MREREGETLKTDPIYEMELRCIMSLPGNMAFFSRLLSFNFMQMHATHKSKGSLLQFS